ncbi:protein kinase, ATP binding site-containing protein [Tanacetum coccineum]
MFKESSLPPCINSDLYTVELSERWPNHTDVYKMYKVSPDSYRISHIMFNNELEIVSRFHHENIIPLIGYSDEGTDKILFYQHAINGSLRDHLQDQDILRCIPWEKRLKICLGAARGLKCLHSRLWNENTIVVLRHVSSEYILLDENMETKLVNFVCQNFKASMDPIYKQSNIVNSEVDVYSFGVVMIEILSGVAQRTDKFSEELDLIRRHAREPNERLIQHERGKGGFGVAYKKRLSEHWKNHEVAIKRLDKTGHQGKEFLNKLKLIFKFHHQNIILFIGYCDEGDDMILVYEYANTGAAKGLEYLHTGLGEDSTVIHRDVKSGNILLDENIEAKIFDFGLSKSHSAKQQQTKLYTSVGCTNYYTDPIYHVGGILRPDSDVYSFGVVMFEMLSGMLAWYRRKVRDDKPRPLIDMVRQYYDFGKELLMDPKIKDQIDNSSF